MNPFFKSARGARFRAQVPLLCAFLFLLVISVPSATSQATIQPAAPVIVFDVMQNGATVFISPVVLFQSGRFGPPYSTAGGEAARRRFVEKYFRPGQTYFLIVGGGNAGSVKITSGYWQDGAYGYGELERTLI